MVWSKKIVDLGFLYMIAKNFQIRPSLAATRALTVPTDLFEKGKSFFGRICVYETSSKSCE